MQKNKFYNTFGVIGFALTMACWATSASAADTMDHSTMDHSEMDHSEMDHSKMDHSEMDHSKMDHSEHSADEHAEHRAMMEQTGYKRSTQHYNIPPLPLVGMDNNKVTLDELLAIDEPVMLNFIFTTCTTICPVLSATFAQVQRELGDEASQVRMISISIDPEYDTPERLREYAVRFSAGPQWQFYTGTNDDIIAVQKVFDAYRGSKGNHEPLTFLRVPADPQWVRINGLASAADVVKEYRALLAE